MIQSVANQNKWVKISGKVKLDCFLSQLLINVDAFKSNFVSPEGKLSFAGIWSSKKSIWPWFKDIFWSSAEDELFARNPFAPFGRPEWHKNNDSSIVGASTVSDETVLSEECDNPTDDLEALDSYNIIVLSPKGKKNLFISFHKPCENDKNIMIEVFMKTENGTIPVVARFFNRWQTLDQKNRNADDSFCSGISEGYLPLCETIRSGASSVLSTVANRLLHDTQDV